MYNSKVIFFGHFSKTNEKMHSTKLALGNSITKKKNSIKINLVWKIIYNTKIKYLFIPKR